VEAVISYAPNTIMKTVFAFLSSGFNARLARWAGILFVGLFLLAPTSCAKKPTMQVQYAQITGVSPFGVIVNVVLRVNNSNSFDIMVRNIHAQTTLAGQYQLPAVDMQPNLWLAAKKTTFIDAPVTIPWNLVPGLLAATLGNENISYHVQGYADVTATRSIGLRVNNEPLDEQGLIPRELLLQAASPNMR
jgi:LEA14-like dessication related protein